MRRMKVMSFNTKRTKIGLMDDIFQTIGLAGGCV